MLIFWGFPRRPSSPFQSENALARRPQAEKVAGAVWAFGWTQVICFVNSSSKMPGLGRARRKTRPSRCGHSVGLFCDFFSRRVLLCSESNAYAIAFAQ